MLKRRTPGDLSGGEYSAVDTAASSRVPHVVEFLTRSIWGPGDPRQPGTIMLFAEGGVWKAWVNDRDAGLSACTSAGCLIDLLSRVEEGLRDDNLDWRRAKPVGQRKK